MSRKRKAPVRKVYPDPKFHSEIVSKFINSIMYDGKRSTAEKILYDALEKIKSKNNEDPLKIFNGSSLSLDLIFSKASYKIFSAVDLLPSYIIELINLETISEWNLGSG